MIFAGLAHEIAAESGAECFYQVGTRHAIAPDAAAPIQPQRAIEF